MKPGLVLLLAFAVGFAAGRVVPGRNRARRPPTERPRPDATSKVDRTSYQTKKLPPRELPAGQPLGSSANADDSWLAHVLLDPEHHASDGPRITRAVLEQRDAIEAVHACTPLFPATESKLRLRTHVAISSTEIVIGPVESVELVDGIELSEAARDCLIKAFSSSVVTEPSHPSSVHPYRGPFDLSISVVGEQQNETREGVTL